MRESYVQKKVCEFAKSLGWEVRRMGTKDDPDRLFYRHSVVIFIEFKKPLGKRSRGQVDEHNLMKHHTMNIYLIDTIGEGKQIFLDQEHKKFEYPSFD